MNRNIWLISDTHFGHENIIQYCNRPFGNAELMNEYILDMWNETVNDQDIVYHLGDVYFGANGAEVLPKLKGRKRLILGNHDKGKDQNLLRNFQKISMWRMFPEFGMLLTHVPVYQDCLYRQDNYLTNIHGHIHTNPSPKGPYRNVCVEWTDYKPINIEELS